MSINCAELIAQLQTIKKAQTELEAELRAYFEFKNNADNSVADQTAWLRKIYDKKKSLLEYFEARRVDALIDAFKEQIVLDDFEVVKKYFLKKTERRQSLTKKELLFLYEFTSPDDYFLFEMFAIKDSRDFVADLAQIFDCRPEQVAFCEEDVIEAQEKKIEIKVYVGKLFPRFFEIIPESVDNIYSTFPHGKVIKIEIKLGSSDEFSQAMIKNNYIATRMANEILSSSDYTALESGLKIKLAILTVADLGLNKGDLYSPVCDRAGELGLDLCPPEVGPQLRIQYAVEAGDIYIGMEGIKDRRGLDNVFVLKNDRGDQLLSAESIDTLLPWERIAFVIPDKV